MTTGDLTERLARAMHAGEVAEGFAADAWGDMSADSRAWYRANAAAALPIVESEVRAAKAEALREAADDIDFDLGRGYTGADDRNATAAAEVWLRTRAEQITKEDPL